MCARARAFFSFEIFAVSNFATGLLKQQTFEVSPGPLTNVPSRSDSSKCLWSFASALEIVPHATSIVVKQKHPLPCRRCAPMYEHPYSTVPRTFLSRDEGADLPRVGLK